MMYYIQWFKNLALLIALVAGIYISKNFLTGFYQLIALWTLMMVTFIAGLMFIVRTIGVLMMLIFPEKKATAIRFEKDQIIISLGNGTSDSYTWNTINRIILTEKSKGIFINSNKGKQSYTLPEDYKETESKVDAALLANPTIVIKKEKQWVHSNQKGLNPNKSSRGVKRTYSQTSTRELADTMYLNKQKTTIDSRHGVEVIYYSKE